MTVGCGDPYGNRTHVTTVKGWCLCRLTNGPNYKQNRCAFTPKEYWTFSSCPALVVVFVPGSRFIVYGLFSRLIAIAILD